MGDTDWQKKPTDDGRKPSTHARRYVDAFVADFLERAVSEGSPALYMERDEDGRGSIVNEPTRRRRNAAARRMIARLRKVTP